MVLITNAPRTAEAVEQQLARIGLPRDAYDFVATSGEAGIEALNALGKPVGFVGTTGDREILEGSGVRIAEGDDFSDLACTGIRKGGPKPERLSLRTSKGWVARDVQMHCLNPDRRGRPRRRARGLRRSDRRPVRGARRARDLVRQAVSRRSTGMRCTAPGTRRQDEVLAVGDGLQTDVLGAARMGFDAVFVTGGITRRRAVSGGFCRAKRAW